MIEHEPEQMKDVQVWHVAALLEMETETLGSAGREKWKF